MISYKKLKSYEKAIALAVGLVFIFALILCYIGYIYESWKIETFKILLQFLLLVVIGGAFSLLFSQYALEREKRETKKEEYRELLAELIKEYNSAKRIRRLLRAEARFVPNNEEVNIKAEPYHKQMKALINVQLGFEYLKRFVENTDYDELKALGPSLKSIESYLNKIINEYELSYELFSKDESRPIDDLPVLKEFIEKHKDSKPVIVGDFKKEFKEPGGQAMKDLLKILKEI